jgi:hypothetical protein
MATEAARLKAKLTNQNHGTEKTFLTHTCLLMEGVGRLDCGYDPSCFLCGCVWIGILGRPLRQATMHAMASEWIVLP